MTSRERVRAAIDWQGPDRIPLNQMAGVGARAEHGEKLLALWRRYPHDFGDLSKEPVTIAPEGAFGDGYYETKVDEWGATWEYRVYGIAGHPIIRPLDDIAKLDSYQPPPPPPLAGPEFDELARQARLHQQQYYLLRGWINLFETLHTVRNFESVLMDLADNTPEINRLADLVVEHFEACIKQLLVYKVDGILFGDDWGTGTGPIISLDLWRRFFRPRYERLMAPVREAGVHIFFHSCGRTEWLLEDLADLGVNAFWPQLEINDNNILAEWGRRRKVTVFAHPDRTGLMPFGKPEQVREDVRRIKRTFGSKSGGLIFQGEVDRGYPLANIEALYDEIAEN